MMRDELFETDTSFVLNVKFSIPSLIYDPLGFFSISLRNYYYFWKSNNLCTKKIRIGFRLLTRFSSFAYLSSRNGRAIVSSLLIRLFESESYQRSKEISLYARLNESPGPHSTEQVNFSSRCSANKHDLDGLTVGLQCRCLQRV